MKKQLAVCMSLVLGSSAIINSLAMTQIHAIEKASFTAPTAQFSMGEMITVNAGSGAITGNTDLLTRIQNAEDFTFNTKFKLTGTTAVESLFFIGDSTKPDNYVVIYLTPNNKVGVEARNGNTRPLNVAKDTTVTLNDGNVHTFTYTQKKGEYFKFYIDGKVVFEGAAPNAFCKGLISNADYIGFGNGKRAPGSGSYPFTGEIGSIQVFDQAIAEDQIMAYSQGIMSDDEVAYTSNSYFFNENSTYAPQSDIQASALTGMNAGAISVRYRAASADSGKMSLFSISDSKVAGSYMSFYVDPSANTIGVKLSGTNKPEDLVMNDTTLTNAGMSVKNTDWHTLTVVKSNLELGDKANRYTFYMDGTKLDMYSDRVNFFDNVTTADSVNIGFNKTVDDTDAMKFTGAIDIVKVYNKVLSESEAKAEHTIAYTPEQIPDLTNAMKTEPETIFYPGYLGSQSYRIPALLQTKDGTMIAAIDQRFTGEGDAGNIDTILRRKEAGDSSWGDAITVADLVDKNNSTPSAFLIDPSMVQDRETGRIFLLVDMFPESSGIMAPEIIKTGSGYREVDGKHYQQVFDASGKEYLIYEDGTVYNLDGNKTEYRIITKCDAPYKELGNIYKNGKYVGNMFIFSGLNKGELNAVRTSYLYLTYSDDDGKSWSLPKDITPMVKQDWMKFLGTGPGVGLQLKDGTLTFPVYSASSNIGGSQASAMIHSRDGGETWELGESPIALEGYDRETMDNGFAILTESQAVQLNNGDVKLFMRNRSGKVKVATSHDGGMTWVDIKQVPITDVYCQLSITHYERDGKEYVALLNPSGPGRTNGKVYIGEISGSDITWNANKQMNTGAFAYSSIAAMGLDDHGDMQFGAIYESNNGNGITLDYTEFDENFVHAGFVDKTLEAPILKNKTIARDGDTLRITLAFDQTMMAAGDPMINLHVGDTAFGAHYISGSGTSNLVFEAKLDDTMFGVVKADGIDETNGVVENIQNEKVDVAFDVMDLTEVRFVGVSATSEHSNSTAPNTDGAAVNAIDDNPDTYWHSTWGNPDVTLPQSLTLDLGEMKDIYKFSYLPRQNSQSGHVLDFDLYVSDTEDGEFTKVYSGTFENTFNKQSVEFPPVHGQFIKFTITRSSVEGSTSVADVTASVYEDGIFGEVDMTKLETTITHAQALLADGDRYTILSKENLADAIAKAEALKSEVISQNIIDDMVGKLNNAIAKLIDMSSLTKAIQQAEAMDANLYTQESWTVFAEALEEIKFASKDIQVQREVMDLIIRLDYQKEKLVKSEIVEESIKRKVLGAAIKKAQIYNNDALLANVNKKVVKNFKNRLAEAVAVYANSDASDTELQTAWKNLADAMQYLDFTANTSHLEALIAEWVDADMSIYVADENLEEFNAALAHAKDVLNNENSLDASLSAAYDRLTTAISNLTLKEGEIDTIVIDYMLSKSKAIIDNADLYDTASASWATFTKAYKTAVDARAAMDSQEVIDSAAEALAAAYEDVRFIANEDTLKELQAYVDMINAIDMKEYGAETVAYFMNARAMFQNMINSESYSMKEYEAAQALASDVENTITNGKVTPEAPKPSETPSDDASAPETVETPKPSTVTQGTTKPATGDTTRAGVTVGAMLSAGLAAAFVFVKRRKK